MWTNDTMIFVDDFNECWALDNDCQPVCLCQYEDVKKILSGDRSIDALSNPKQKEAMQIILDYRGEYGYGNQSKVKRVNSFRSRPARDFEHRPSAIKRATTSKRTAVHQDKQQKQSIPS